jgi:hypothetical protein
MKGNQFKEYNNSSNSYKRPIKQNNVKKLYSPKKTFLLDNNFFPNLQTNSNQEEYTETEELNKSSIDFKKALSNDITVENTKKVKSGCVEISKGKNGKIQYNYGENTSPIKTTCEDDEDYYNKNINKIMIHTIDKMRQNWDSYKKNYDDLYGEGSYDEIYYTSPLYGSEYSDTESEYISDSYSDYEYM